VFNPTTALCDSQFICEFQCPLEDGIYSDPKNCEKFFFCRDRTAIEMKCPEESPVFNPELRVCDSRSNYPCGHAPDHGGWSDWSEWSNCSLPCGNGTSMRVRTCDNPNPVNGGNECQGPANETQMCNTHHCPVDGGWGNWTVWGSCSKTCGDGTEIRSKPCDSPAPAYGGNNCSGQGTESRRCNVKPCPVDGGWGNWTVWGSCSKTCGDGTQTRSKSCDSPAPAYGGNNCSGQGTESRRCNVKACPVNGEWGSWGNWSSCSKSCDGGLKTRTKKCDSPAPANGGKNCTGQGTENMVCNPEGCPCVCGAGCEEKEFNGLDDDSFYIVFNGNLTENPPKFKGMKQLVHYDKYGVKQLTNNSNDEKIKKEACIKACKENPKCQFYWYHPDAFGVPEGCTLYARYNHTGPHSVVKDPENTFGSSLYFGSVCQKPCGWKILKGHEMRGAGNKWLASKAALNVRVADCEPHCQAQPGCNAFFYQVLLSGKGECNAMQVPDVNNVNTSPMPWEGRRGRDTGIFMGPC